MVVFRSASSQHLAKLLCDEFLAYSQEEAQVMATAGIFAELQGSAVAILQYHHIGA